MKRSRFEYKYKLEEDGSCAELCQNYDKTYEDIDGKMILGSNVYIGSAACNVCIHNIELKSEYNLISCSRIAEALGCWSLNLSK